MLRRTIVVRAGATYVKLSRPPTPRKARYDIVALLSPSKPSVVHDGARHLIFTINGEEFIAREEDVTFLDQQREIGSE